MVVGPSVLIVGDDEQAFEPGRRLADGLPDVEKEFLAGNDIVRRVLVIRIDEEAGLEEGVLREVAARTVLFKGVEVVKMVAVAIRPEIGKHETGKRRDDVGITVNTPVYAQVLEHVEYVADIPVEGVRDVSVVDVAVRRPGVDEGAVGPSLAWDRTEIAVGDGETGCESGDDWELGGTEWLHDFDGNGARAIFIAMAIAARGVDVVGVVDKESQVWPGRIGTGSFGSEELVGDIGEGLLRIGIGISG